MTDTRRAYATPKVTDLVCSQCEERATQRYKWAWGEEGLVCDGHRATLQQAADQTVQRTIAFSPLFAPEAPSAPGENPELSFAKAKLLEMEEELHASEATRRAQLDRIHELETELARKDPPVRAVRAAQIDSDVEAAPTASTGPTESPSATQSQPTKPRR
jgi:hypothetical protein